MKRAEEVTEEVAGVSARDRVFR